MFRRLSMSKKLYGGDFSALLCSDEHSAEVVNIRLSQSSALHVTRCDTTSCLLGHRYYNLSLTNPLSNISLTNLQNKIFINPTLAHHALRHSSYYRSLRSLLPLRWYPYIDISLNIHRQLLSSSRCAPNSLWKRISCYRDGLVLSTRCLPGKSGLLHRDCSHAPAHHHGLCEFGRTMEIACYLGRNWRSHHSRVADLGELKEAGEDGLTQGLNSGTFPNEIPPFLHFYSRSQT